MKLFLDANVLFTAAYSDNGICRSLFQLAEAGRCNLTSSSYAVDEARRNLLLKAPAKITQFEKLLDQVTLVREPSTAVVLRMIKVPLIQKDAPILAAAVESSATVLVTGDRRDFGHLFGKNIEGVLVAMPLETLEILLQQT